MADESELKKLVLIRLEAMPDNVRVSIGSFGELNKNDLIRHVQAEDGLGKSIISTQLKYLQSMKEL